jgi:hypothetical protein
MHRRMIGRVSEMDAFACLMMAQVLFDDTCGNLIQIAQRMCFCLLRN